MDTQATHSIENMKTDLNNSTDVGVHDQLLMAKGTIDVKPNTDHQRS